LRTDGAADSKDGRETFVQTRARPRRVEPEQGGDTVALLALLIAVLAVGVGLATEAHGLGVVYFVLVCPALIATLIKRRRRGESRRAAHWGETLVEFLVDFLGAVAATIGIIIALVVAAVIALSIFCAVAMSRGSFH